MGEFSGKRRRQEEKVSILLESFFTQWNLVLPSNPRTFKRKFRIARQYIWLPNDFAEYIYHIGNVYEMHFIIQRGLIPGGKSNRRDRQSVFFTAVSPMDIHLDQREVEYDLDKP